MGPGWTISHDNIITGVPRNDWHLSLGAGQCVDVVPVGEGSFAVRPYRIGDKFAGAPSSGTVEPTRFVPAPRGVTGTRCSCA